jgi:hypothetical protein
MTFSQRDHSEPVTGAAVGAWRGAWGRAALYLVPERDEWNRHQSADTHRMNPSHNHVADAVAPGFPER